MSLFGWFLFCFSAFCHDFPHFNLLKSHLAERQRERRQVCQTGEAAEFDGWRAVASHKRSPGCLATNGVIGYPSHRVSYSVYISLRCSVFLLWSILKLSSCAFYWSSVHIRGCLIKDFFLTSLWQGYRVFLIFFFLEDKTLLFSAEIWVLSCQPD